MRFNQSILKVISPGCSLDGLMLKLKLQYFGHPIQRADSFERLWCWERLKAGEEGDDRGWDGWMTSPTQWTWVWVNSGSWWWTASSGICGSLGHKESDTTEGLNRAGVFWMSQFFASDGQITRVSASPSVLPMNIQDWFPLRWTGWISLQSKGLSRVFSNTTVQRHQFFGAQLSLQSNSTSIHDYWKSHSLD